MSNILRVAVSKQKRRYQKNGYDLDLAYITDRIIAMGFPSEKVEGVYRNPMKEVQKFLDHFHKDHYKVYNLCSERDYDHSKFYGRVGCFPFDDHNAPTFEMIESFCKDVDAWMKEDEKNIAVIHCKAGKGRTGLMICCWLLYCGMWKNTEESLQFYAALRTYNQKGVTIPSQIRYVHYFGKACREKMVYTPRTVLIKKLVLKPPPKEFNINDVTFTIHVGKTLIFHSRDVQNLAIHKVEKKKKQKKQKKLTKENSQPHMATTATTNTSNGTEQGSSSNNISGSSANQQSGSPSLDGTISRSQSMSSFSNLDYSYYSAPGGKKVSEHEPLETPQQTAQSVDAEEYIAFEIGSLPLVGDIKIDFSDKGERMFMYWFNTSFVNLHESISKTGLDKAYKDKNHKSYPEDFRVEMFFESLEPTQSQNSNSSATLVASSEIHLNNQNTTNSSSASNSLSSSATIPINGNHSNTTTTSTSTTVVESH